MPRVLLIEDNFEMSALLEYSLKAVVDIDVAYLRKDIEALVEKFSYDLVILDLGLPDCHGYEVFKWMKQKATRVRSIIVLSADDSEDSQIEGFNLGIDDYIVKPVRMNILKAKILNKLKVDLVKTNRINFGPLCVDLNSFRVYVTGKEDLQEAPLDLTPIEFKILVSLLKHQNQIVTRDMLFAEVWNNSVFVGNRVIDQHVSALRKKLGTYSNCVHTVYGEGYKIDTHEKLVIGQSTKREELGMH